jgi:hypothetical protein
MYHTHGARFGGGGGFGAGLPMTDDQIRSVAPSVFAIEKHESRSARFSYIPTFEILAGLRKEGFQVVNAVQGKSRVEGKEQFTKHMLRLKHPDHGTVARMGGVTPEAILLNAHDGTSSYRLMSGILRGICLNSLICWEDGATDVRVPHKGDILGQVIEGTFEVIGDSARTLDRADSWQAIALNRDEQMALAEAAHTLRFGEPEEGESTTLVRADQLLAPRRREDVGDNLWLSFNRIQENSIRGGVHAFGRNANGQRRRQTTREINGIDQNVRLNRALWQLSARMAEIKAGIAA